MFWYTRIYVLVVRIRVVKIGIASTVHVKFIVCLPPSKQVVMDRFNTPRKGTIG